MVGDFLLCWPGIPSDTGYRAERGRRVGLPLSYQVAFAFSVGYAAGMGWLKDLIAKTFRTGPAVVEAADVAFGKDPAEWAPEQYGSYFATSSAVYACASLRARNLASLPLVAYKDGEALTDGDLVSLLRSVNPHWTLNRLLQMTELTLCLWGQAFWVLERGQDGEGVPTEIWWARPDKMRLVPDPTNYLAGWIYEDNLARLAFRTSEVIWFRFPNPLDEFAGLSPIAATRLAVDTGHSALRSNYSIFKNGVHISGVVTPADSETTWQREQVEALRDMLEKRFKGAEKSHKLAVLGQAAKFTSIGVSPNDAQFIELMKWTRADVAMVYGIPPELIGDQESSTYNNVEQAHKGFWTNTMTPEAVMIAEELTEQLLPMFKGEADKIEFDLSGVMALQQDLRQTAEQAKIWYDMGVPLNAILRELAPQFLDNGEGYEWGDVAPGAAGKIFKHHLDYQVLSTNEIRDSLGLPPVAGGDSPPAPILGAPMDVQAGIKYAEYPGLSFLAPAGVQAAAQRGLRLYEDGRGGAGLQPETIRWARRMAAGDDISPDKLRLMRAWFARHESDRVRDWDKPGRETPGFVAWLLWGGDAGRAWAERMVSAMERMDAERGEARAVSKAAGPIVYGSPEHIGKASTFQAQADRLQRRTAATVTRLFEQQKRGLVDALRLQAAKAIENQADLDAIWDETLWQDLFREGILDQLQDSAEAGATSTLRELRADTALFNLESPEVQAFLRSRSQRFAEEVNATTWDRVRSSLAEGIEAGEGITELEARVEQTMGDRIRSSAETIARTETIGALNGGALLGAEVSGRNPRKAWLASLDGRERETHAAVMAETQANPIGLNENFQVGGASGPAPGQTGDAGEDINCRCTMTWAVQDDNGQRTLIPSETIALISDWVKQK